MRYQYQIAKHDVGQFARLANGKEKIQWKA